MITVDFRGKNWSFKYFLDWLDATYGPVLLTTYELVRDAR